MLFHPTLHGFLPSLNPCIPAPPVPSHLTQVLQCCSEAELESAWHEAAALALLRFDWRDIQEPLAAAQATAYALHYYSPQQVNRVWEGGGGQPHSHSLGHPFTPGSTHWLQHSQQLTYMCVAG